MKYLPLLLILFLILTDFKSVSAQQTNESRGAFLRSMVVPGWGHYYNDRDDWDRGKIHLAIEISIIAAYLGFQHQSSTIKSEYTTLANLRSGVDIRDHNRSFQIALSDFQSLEDYNNFQLRTRNWNRLLEVNNENNWQWQSERDRMHYGDLRSKRDRIRNQLPALLGSLVVNRVIGAFSAYNRAAQSTSNVEVSVIPIYDAYHSNGAITKLTYRF